MTVTRHTEHDEIRRPLSPMERWYWISDQISPLNVVARVHVTGACTPQDLARAGERLAQEHPLLRVAITAEQDGSRPRFAAARHAGIPVRTVRCDSPTADRWEQEVNDTELVSSLDWRAGSLARITDIAQGAAGSDGECHDLLLTVSHIIADGTTALELLRRLVELATDEGAGAASRLAAAPHRPLPPPEVLLPRWINRLPRAVHFALVVIADQMVHAVARPRRLVPDEPVPPARRRSRLIRHELGTDQLDALVSRCRQEGVTVHGALAAAMVLAVSDPPAAPSGGRSARVTLGSPVDFRADLHPPVGPQDAGAYVATVPSHIRTGPNADLWAVARAVLRDLRVRKRFHHHLALVSMLRFITPRSVGQSAKAVAMIDRAGPGNLCLSNIGRHDFPARAGRWELSGAQFIAGISISGYLVAAVNTSHGVLHWNFTHIEDAVTRERAERIAQRAVHTLLAAVESTAASTPDTTSRAGKTRTTTRRG